MYKKTTYSVYRYYSAFTSGSQFTNLEGKNIVVNLAGATDAQTLPFGTGSGSGNSSIILLTSGAIDAATDNAIYPAAALGNQKDIKAGAAADTRYYSFTTTGRGGAFVQATGSATFITLSKVGNATQTSVKVTDAVTHVKLAAGSPGAAGEASITRLTAGNKYVVYNGTNWFKVVETGAPTQVGNFADAITGSVALTEEGTPVTTISNLINGTTYTVYLYDVLGNGKSVGIDGTGNVDNGGKNAVLSISALTVNQSVTVAAGAGDDSTNIIFLIADTVAITVDTGELDAQEIKNTRATPANPLFYGFSDTEGVRHC